ncbi:MAG: 4'-phosphopantetheinyl transferase superfamily protein [Flavobacteriales bacterium]
MTQQFLTDNGATILISSIEYECRSMKSIQEASPGKSRVRLNQLWSSEQMVKRICGVDVWIMRDDQGRPTLVNSPKKVSISHSSDRISVIAGDDRAVAIDIERSNRSVSKIADRFTTPSEVDLFQQVFPKNPALVIWTCKECLFKILGSQAVMFKDDLVAMDARWENDTLCSEWSINHHSFSGKIQTKSFIFEDVIVSYID